MSNIVENQEESKARLVDLIEKRAFTGNIKMCKDYVCLYEKNKKAARIGTSTLFKQIKYTLQFLYENLEKYKQDEKINITLMYFSVMMTMIERAQRYMNDGSQEFYVLNNILKSNIEQIKKLLGDDFPEYMIVLLSNCEDVNKTLKDTINVDKLDDEDIINLLNQNVSKEDISAYLSEYVKLCSENVALQKRLDELGLLDVKKVRACLDDEFFYDCIKNGKMHMLKYLNTNEYYKAFFEGYIDAKTLGKYTKIQDLFNGYLEKDEIMAILDKKIYIREASDFIWELYEKDFWNAEEMNHMAELGYMNSNLIIEKYLEEQKRKIAKALKQTSSISDEKLLEFFTPQKVLNEEKSNKNLASISSFYKNELRAIYEKFGRDLERELIDEEKKNIEEEQSTQSLTDLYKSGLVRLSKFNKGEISEPEILDLYYESSDEQILIDAYNAGLVSQECILEQFEDEELIFKKIKDGLNASILNGYYGTSELLNLYKDGKIELEDLKSLKSNIDIDKIKALYLAEELSYGELFGLAKDGIIDLDIAKEINDEYDIEAGWQKLKERGGLFGRDIDLFRSAEDKMSPKRKARKKYERNEDSDYASKKIDEDLKKLLFESLGAGESIDVSGDLCGLFKSYKVIPFIEKKLAILEGDGRTYILPMKVILEQVNNRGSKDDLIGNATYRKDLYSNKKYVRTAYHTLSWGRNVVKRMCELNEDLDSEKLISENEELLKEIESSYRRTKKEKDVKLH